MLGPVEVTNDEDDGNDGPKFVCSYDEMDQVTAHPKADPRLPSCLTAAGNAIPIDSVVAFRDDNDSVL